MSDYNGILDYRGVQLERFHWNLGYSTETKSVTTFKLSDIKFDRSISVTLGDCFIREFRSCATSPKSRTGREFKCMAFLSTTYMCILKV